MKKIFKSKAAYLIAEGFRSIFTHGLMSFAAICMIVACLLIMGSFSLVALNLDRMLSDLEAQNEFLAYLDESLTDEEVSAIGLRIEAMDNVAEVRFISREEAMETFLLTQDNALFTDVPESTFRHRYAVKVVDIEQMRQTSDAVKEITGIDRLSVDLEIAEGFVAVRNVATAIAAILILILVAVSMFIISNTTRLATFNRREEIAIMKMCGATDGFVRIPFIIEGLILGLMGAFIAFFAQWGIYELLLRAVGSQDLVSLISLIPFRLLAGRIAAIFTGVGFLVGMGGSGMAISRFLKV